MCSPSDCLTLQRVRKYSAIINWFDLQQMPVAPMSDFATIRQQKWKFFASRKIGISQLHQIC